MTIFQHHILATAPHGAGAVARHGVVAGAVAEAAGGSLFGVFTPHIGLSTNHVVMISHFPDEAAAATADLVGGTAVEIERHEFWDAAPRPAAGETITETGGVFSHRWFDCAEADWPRFQELSIGAWSSFEDVNDTRVIGFWRSRTQPASGVVRVWLMAWYRDLAAWQGSRWYNDTTNPAAAAYRERFAERRALTLDSAVSILTRVV